MLHRIITQRKSNLYNKEYDQKNLLLLQAQGAIGEIKIDAICKLSYELQRQKFI